MALAVDRKGRTLSIKGLIWGLLFGITTLNAAELPDTVAHIKASVVGVGTFQRTRRPPLRFMGTGFVVADGRHVITNLHVIPLEIDETNREALAIFIATRYGVENEPLVRLASMVAKESEHDLALLKFSDEPLPALTIGDSDQVREGETYAFTGFPLGAILGLYPVTHHALISAITPVIEPYNSAYELRPGLIERLKDPYLVFQLDATAYPGNSGSPLYNPATGVVVGVINKVFVQGTKENLLTQPSGISYAIPSNYVKALLVKAGLK